ncbi:MAG: hypothetical protein HFI42_04145 [Lachnospiraceae bacterium]|nr:hypothetical protein [Lachnospiraceae bacterium]
MKKKYLLCLLCLLLVLCGCGQQSKGAGIYMSPRQRQSVGMLDKNLIFCINDSLYYAKEQDGRLTLEKVEGENGTVGYFTCIYPGEKGDTAYLVLEDTMEIETLSKSYERTPVCQIPEDATQKYTYGLVTGGSCYAIKPKMGNASTGQLLVQIPLEEGGERTTVHEWEDSYYVDVFPPSAPNIHARDSYLIATYPYIEGEPLWVYDTKKQEMVIQGDPDMSYAAYFQEKLYFVENSTGSIRTYDLEQQRLLEDSIPIADYVPGVTLSCDESYLYVSRVSQEEWPREDSSQTLVYNYEGELVDVIDMRENPDAVAWEICDNPLFCVLLCSTEDYVFFGSSMAETYGLFYVEKSKIGSEELTIHTLYQAQ